MSFWAFSVLVTLYLIYGFGLLASFGATHKTETYVTRGVLKTVLMIEFVELLCVVGLWLDHNPTSSFRLFLTLVLGAEIVFESVRGIRHYSASIPIKRRPVSNRAQTVILVILVSLLAFVP